MIVRFSFNSVSVCSFNCEGLKSSINHIKDLCTFNDVILLQEHWLYNDELVLLNSIDNDFIGCGVSAMNFNDRLVTGRPYGGVAVMWKKSMSPICKPVIYDDECRIIGLEIANSNGTIYHLLNVYLPYECYDNYDEYFNYLHKLGTIMSNSNTPYIYVIGDLNSNISNPNSRFAKELRSFCTKQCMSISDELCLPNDCYTFISKAHGTSSWLDHCLTTHSAHNTVKDISVYKGIVTEGHFPLICKFDCSVKLIDTCESPAAKLNYNWKGAEAGDLHKYNMLSDKFLSKVKLPEEIVFCKDPNCKSDQHRNLIDKLYSDIINSLTDAVKLSIPVFKNNNGNVNNQVPGWNDYVEEHHVIARDGFHLWDLIGRPRQGVIYENMKQTRARFKYALRYCKKQEECILADKLANDLSDKDLVGFWKSVKKLNNTKTPLTNTMGDVSGEVNIAECWRKHFSALLNCVTSTDYKNEVCNAISTIEFDENMCVNVNEVNVAIMSLKSGKACGADGLPAEAFKQASQKLHVYLSLCFSAMLIHGYIPSPLTESIIIPLVKNKCGNLSDVNNYRPIALATISSKCFEKILLSRCEIYLSTSDQQFGFKNNSSTDMCIYLLKECIATYNNLNTPVFVTFLDASKAFDRVNHWTLFYKLLKLNMPKFLVRILMFWYQTQQMYVKWGSSISGKFNVCNGVKQGGILSPLLFNVYINDITACLNNSKVGCILANSTINHLLYADDLCLISPSTAGLQKLLDICGEFGSKHDLIYNSLKSVTMCFIPKTVKLSNIPDMVLNDSSLEIVTNCKYLGVQIENQGCVRDIKRQLTKFYININRLIRMFNKCSDFVKCHLFRSYCANLYCSQFWFSCTKRELDSLRVGYNNGLRRLLKLPKSCSASQMFQTYSIPSFGELHRKSVYGFIDRINKNKNRILHNIAYSSTTLTSKIWSWWRTVLYP